MELLNSGHSSDSPTLDSSEDVERPPTMLLGTLRKSVVEPRWKFETVWERRFKERSGAFAISITGFSWLVE